MWKHVSVFIKFFSPRTHVYIHNQIYINNCKQFPTNKFSKKKKWKDYNYSTDHKFLFLTFQKKNWLHHNLNICHQKVCIHAHIHMYKYIKNQFSIEWTTEKESYFLPLLNFHSVSNFPSKINTTFHCILM